MIVIDCLKTCLKWLPKPVIKLGGGIDISVTTPFHVEIRQYFVQRTALSRTWPNMEG